MLINYPSRVMVADALGYMSIGCWLCAQLPQVIKNASLRSCEGLALPFLCSWLFGDLTNLIGCLLTDQLPFQTYLAIYFCTIDMALVGQYIHYRKPSPRVSTSTGQTPRYVSYNTLIASPHQSLILPPSTAPPGGRTRSSSGNFITSSVPNTARPSRSRRNPTYSHLPPPDINVTSSSPADGSYAAIYEAALDVARAAERASHRRRSRSKRRKLSRQTSASNVLDEEDLADSFHSELSNKSSSTINGGAPASPRRLTQSTGTLLNDSRGRSMTRTPIHPVSPLPPSNSSSNDNLEGLPTSGTLGLILGTGAQADLQMRENKRSQSRSLSLVRGSGGRGGRRAAGVAFMSLGLLVGWGGFANNAGGPVRSVGKVLVGPTSGISNYYQPSSYDIDIDSQTPSSSTYHTESNPPIEDTQIREYVDSILYTDQKDSPTAPPPHMPEDPPSFQRIIGRISAWACTTLYLASRLPQIWKNFQRKSVEGLSILLFVMAFLGNVTYVSSILLNPAGGGDPNEAGHYLLEALPYLLGSGGTLIFDLTIMIQSVLYGSAPPLPIPPTPMERSSRRRGYFTKRKLKHIEDGFSHPHPHAHVRTHSYTQQSSSQQHERTPLLPPPNIQNSLGLGIEVNGSRSRSKSPEQRLGGKRTVDEYQGG